MNENLLITLDRMNSAFLAISKSKAVLRTLIGELEADLVEPSKDFGIMVKVNHDHISTLLHILTDYTFEASESLKAEIDRLESP